MRDTTLEQLDEMSNKLSQALTLANMLRLADDGIEQAQLNDVGGMFERLLSQPLEVSGNPYVEKQSAERKLSAA